MNEKKIIITLKPIDEGKGGRPSWFVSSDQLPGCMTDGTTEFGALLSFANVLKEWLECGIIDGAFGLDDVIRE